MNGVTTRLLHDGLNPAQELVAANSPVANLLPELGLDEFFTRCDAQGVRHILPDALERDCAPRSRRRLPGL